MNDSGNRGPLGPASKETAESPNVDIPAASARPGVDVLRMGDEVWAAISPAIRTAGLEESQVPLNAEEISIDATRLRLLLGPARNGGRVGGLGGGVEIRQVLARFPVKKTNYKLFHGVRLSKGIYTTNFEPISKHCIFVIKTKK